MLNMFKNYIIYGVGISGINCAKYLVKKGFEVILTDDNAAKESENSHKISGAKFVKSELISEEIYENSVVIFSPGIPLYHPKKHKILEIVNQKGAKLMCDIELFYLLNKDSGNKFVAVTGTNGKSTCVALIDFILKEIGINSYLAGNIGFSPFEIMMKGDEISNQNFILEMSSYQLDLCSEVSFDVAAITNFSHDHIDRHGNFENYIEAKKRIFLNQTSEQFAILNYDDENCREISRNLNSSASLVRFSISEKVDGGVSILNQTLNDNIAGNEFGFKVESEYLNGRHNLENIALSYACVSSLLKIRGVEIDNNLQNKIALAIKKFQGLKHRMQFLGEIDGVKFVNDSKATNSESAKTALESYDNILWIVGGVAKEGGIENLAPYFKKIGKAYLIGESSQDFAKFLKKSDVNYEECINLENAAKKAFRDAKDNINEKPVIMLSPACASFDQWKNFEERGEHFCKIFNEFKEN